MLLLFIVPQSGLFVLISNTRQCLSPMLILASFLEAPLAALAMEAVALIVRSHQRGFPRIGGFSKCRTSGAKEQATVCQI